MQIKFELPGERSEKRLNQEILPVGYFAEMDSIGDFYIKLDSNNEMVAVCELLEEPFILFSFFNLKPAGLDFMVAFGLKYPEHNPTTVLFGIVYKTEAGYQLDKMPLRTREEALKEIKHYVALGSAYFVTFFRANWTDETLLVNHMLPIDMDGSLGPDMGEKLLFMGKIENDQTM